jgi:hypothetical protein
LDEPLLAGSRSSIAAHPRTDVASVKPERETTKAEKSCMPIKQGQRDSLNAWKKYCRSRLDWQAAEKEEKEP